MKPIFSIYGYGLGHATRCESIINKLRSNVKIMASENAYDYFNKKGHNPIKINSFKIGNIMKSFSWVQTLFENVDFPFNMLADYNKIKRLSSDFKPDIIISDTEPVSMLFSHTSGIPNCFLSNLMPVPSVYEKLPHYVKNNKLMGQEAVIRMLIDQVLKKSELVLSPTIHQEPMGYKVKYTDLIVRQQPKQLPSIDEIRKKHDLPDNFILVSFGGASITNEYYESIIPVLKELTDYDFVVSTNHAVKRLIRSKNLTLYPFINDYLEVLKASQGIICLAGHSTISEAMVYGKPCFIIPIQDHLEQLVNAQVISERGLGEALFYKNDIKHDKLKSKLKIFLQGLDDYSRSIKNNNFKGNGGSESVNEIRKALK